MGLQDAASPVMHELIMLHDQVMYVLVLIVTLVLWLMVRALTTRHYNRYLLDGTLIEVV